MNWLSKALGIGGDESPMLTRLEELKAKRAELDKEIARVQDEINAHDAMYERIVAQAGTKPPAEETAANDSFAAVSADIQAAQASLAKAQQAGGRRRKKSRRRTRRRRRQNPRRKTGRRRRRH